MHEFVQICVELLDCKSRLHTVLKIISIKRDFEACINSSIKT